MLGTPPKKNNIDWELAEEILNPRVFRHLKTMYFMFQKDKEKWIEYANDYLTRNKRREKALKEKQLKNLSLGL